MLIGDVVQLTEPPMSQLAIGLGAATAWRIARAPRVATLQTIACVSRVWALLARALFIGYADS